MNKMTFAVYLFFVFSMGASAASNHKIIKVHSPGEFGKNYSLFMNNGEIFEIDKQDLEMAQKAISAKDLGRKVELELDVTSEESKTRTKVLRIEIKVEEAKVSRKKINKEYYSEERIRRVRVENRNPLSNYKLANLSSYEKAQEVMNSFNGDTDKDSQCYARAHMWTYEAFMKHGENLGKVWIFFASKYIREFDYKWWFHVAPFTNIEGYNTPMILDRGFTKSPYQLNNWKNIFMKNKAQCRQIFNYFEYTQNTNREYCFLMFSSAYYWQPIDLENLSRRGTFRWGYVMRDLDWSYSNGLGRRGLRAPYHRGRANHDAYRRRN